MIFLGLWTIVGNLFLAWKLRKVIKKRAEARAGLPALTYALPPTIFHSLLLSYLLAISCTNQVTKNYIRYFRHKRKEEGFVTTILISRQSNLRAKPSPTKTRPNATHSPETPPKILQILYKR